MPMIVFLVISLVKISEKIGSPCHARAKEEFAKVFTLDALPVPAWKTLPCFGGALPVKNPILFTSY